MIKPTYFVDSERILHNVVASGSLVFLDCLGVSRVDPLPDTRVEGEELIWEDHKHAHVVSSGVGHEEVRAMVVSWKHAVVVLGAEAPQAATILEALKHSAVPGHLRCYVVPEAVAMAYFRRVPVLRIPRVEVPHEIVPRLFLGDFSAASRSCTLLKSLGITHVVNASNGMARNRFASEGIKYFNVDIPDMDDVDISQYFDEVHAFVAEARRAGGGVLVHCAAGVSRSTTLVICFLMREYSLPLREAATVVKSIRRIVQPNCGFVRQLMRAAGEPEPPEDDPPFFNDLYLEPGESVLAESAKSAVMCANGLTWKCGQVIANRTRSFM